MGMITNFFICFYKWWGIVRSLSKKRKTTKINIKNFYVDFVFLQFMAYDVINVYNHLLFFVTSEFTEKEDNSTINRKLLKDPIKSVYEEYQFNSLR